MSYHNSWLLLLLLNCVGFAAGEGTNCGRGCSFSFFSFLILHLSYFLYNAERSVPSFAARSFLLLSLFLVLFCRFYAVFPPSISPQNIKTPAQKELRRLCGGNTPKYVAGQVLGVLNCLTADPGLISASMPEDEEPDYIQALRRKLAELLKETPVDEDTARRTALDLAAKQLDAIGPEEYETERLRRVFKSAVPLKDLDTDLLRGSVQRITIRKRHAVVRLKNEQIIEGGSGK